MRAKGIVSEVRICDFVTRVAELKLAQANSDCTMQNAKPQYTIVKEYSSI